MTEVSHEGLVAIHAQHGSQGKEEVLVHALLHEHSKLPAGHTYSLGIADGISYIIEDGNKSISSVPFMKSCLHAAPDGQFVQPASGGAIWVKTLQQKKVEVVRLPWLLQGLWHQHRIVVARIAPWPVLFCLMWWDIILVLDAMCIKYGGNVGKFIGDNFKRWQDWISQAGFSPHHLQKASRRGYKFEKSSKVQSIKVFESDEHCMSTYGLLIILAMWGSKLRDQERKDAAINVLMHILSTACEYLASVPIIMEDMRELPEGHALPSAVPGKMYVKLPFKNCMVPIKQLGKSAARHKLPGASVLEEQAETHQHIGQVLILVALNMESLRWLFIQLVPALSYWVEEHYKNKPGEASKTQLAEQHIKGRRWHSALKDSLTGHSKNKMEQQMIEEPFKQYWLSRQLVQYYMAMRQRFSQKAWTLIGISSDASRIGKKETYLYILKQLDDGPDGLCCWAPPQVSGSVLCSVCVVFVIQSSMHQELFLFPALVF